MVTVGVRTDNGFVFVPLSGSLLVEHSATAVAAAMADAPVMTICI